MIPFRFRSVSDVPPQGNIPWIVHYAINPSADDSRRDAQRVCPGRVRVEQVPEGQDRSSKDFFGAEPVSPFPLSQMVELQRLITRWSSLDPQEEQRRATSSFGFLIKNSTRFLHSWHTNS